MDPSGAEISLANPTVAGDLKTTQESLSATIIYLLMRRKVDDAEMDDALAAELLPERPARAYKGTFGRLLILAGSLDYAGAALLVCRAAGRSGVGLVTLAVPESLTALIASRLDGLDAAGVRTLLRLASGPGAPPCC